MLNADEIGEKGQLKFQEICIDAGFVCNQSRRDRTGWDFLVEFPFDHIGQSGIVLETRRTPISCVVQVKTIFADNDRIKLRLSVAERLAKEVKPSFIFIIKIDRAYNFVGMYGMHVIGGVLLKILKRLRQEDVKKNGQPNKKSISFSASSEGELIHMSGDGLRRALNAACGDDIYQYANMKLQQLKKIGFGPRPYKINVAFGNNSYEDLVDLFLGIKPDMMVEKFEVSQERFGISVNESHGLVGDTKISIEPSPLDVCTIVLRKNYESDPVVFSGEVFIPAIPGLPKEYRKLLIKTAFFNMIIGNEDFLIESNADTARQTPSSWAAYFRFCLAVAEKEGILSISGKNSSLKADIDVACVDVTLDVEEFEEFYGASIGLSVAVKFFGIVNEPIIDLKFIRDNLNLIKFVDGLLTNKNSVAITFLFDRHESFLEMEFQRIAYIDFIQILESYMIYCCSAEAACFDHGDKVLWDLTKIKIIRADLGCEDKLNDETYINEVMSKAEVKFALIRKTKDGGGYNFVKMV